MLLECIVPFLSTSIDIISKAKVKNDDDVKKSTGSTHECLNLCKKSLFIF